MKARSAMPTGVCPQCGREFRCGMEGGDAECWCAALPPLIRVPAQAGTAAVMPSCLCPDCLPARLSLSGESRGPGLA